MMANSELNFKKLAIEEMRKMFKNTLVNQASRLMHGVEISDFTKWGKPGIRPQLFDVEQKKMIMDFYTEGDKDSFHVLNAVSPALTASIPFSEYCRQKIDNLLL